MLFKCIKYPWRKQYPNYFSHFLESGSRMPKYLLAMNNVYKQKILIYFWDRENDFENGFFWLYYLICKQVWKL